MPSKVSSTKPTYAEVAARSLSPQPRRVEASSAPTSASGPFAERPVRAANLGPNGQDIPKPSAAVGVTRRAFSPDATGDSNRAVGRVDRSSKPSVFVSKFAPSGRTTHVLVSDAELDSDEEADSGTRMDPDDSMYKGRPYNSRVSSAHNPTSIIQTRASKRAEAVVSRTTSSKRADAIAVDSENDGAPPLHPSPRLRRPQRSRIQTESETEDALAPAEEAEHSPDPNKYDVTDPFIDDSEVLPTRGRRMERQSSASSHRRNRRRSSPDWADMEAEEVLDDDDAIVVVGSKKRRSTRRAKSREYHERTPEIRAMGSPRTPSRMEVDVPDQPVQESVAVSSKRSRSHSPVVVRKRVSRRSPSHDSESAPLATGHQATVPHRRTFASVLGPATATTSDGAKDLTPLVASTQYLGDFEYRQPTDLPEHCEVTDPSLQDAALVSFYPKLPALRSCLYESWNDLDGPGMVSFSQWSINCPDMFYDSCLNVINFEQHGDYIGPARISPQAVRIRTVTGAKSRYYLYTAERKPALCISSIFVKDSHVLAPPDKGLVQKSVTGIFHSQEWERTVGFMGTVFGHKVLRAQVSMDAMQFTTRAHFGNKDSSPSKQSPSKNGKGKLSSMFSNKRSPASSAKANSIRSSYLDTFSLDYDADIPVYDCRSVDLDLERDLDQLHTLPRWEDEIPFGAFAVVAYTVAVFRAEKTNAWTVSYNLQWAMILGIAMGNS